MATTSITGVTIGHWTDPVAETGCTVVLLPRGTCASYEVRGGAPASRELLCLEPDKSVTTIDGICLTGGSVFGLAAADGVVAWLEEQDRGVTTPAGPVPIVPTLGLFDLGVGDAAVRPTATSGQQAAAAAAAEFETGQVGAGTGARVSKWRREAQRPGGIVYAERRSGEVVVGALVACNAFGDISIDTAGEVSMEAVEALPDTFGFDRSNTTIGAVLTNARLDKVGCRVLAQGAHDGLARAVTPPHTRVDGDAFVAAASGTVEAPLDLVRMLGLGAVVDALRTLG